MAVIMVIGCIVCSIIIGIIIRSTIKTQYGLANKMITVNAENKDDDTITETSKEMKNEAYGCLRHGTNRIANADLQNIQMQDQESAEVRHMNTYHKNFIISITLAYGKSSCFNQSL